MRMESTLVWPKRLHWEKYFRPQTIPEALSLLEEFRGSARLLAGGTDLIPQIRNREMEPKVLVDITRIPGLGEIQLKDGIIKIGALVTHAQVVESSLIREKALALSEGASQVGSPQIRNMGTVAGNVVSGQPGADATVPLLALDATVKVISKQGERTIRITDFFLDTGKTRLESNREMVTEIFFPALMKNESSVSLRLAKRKSLALPILNVSVVVSADLRQKKFNDVRIALGPVAPTPLRAKQAEGMLHDSPITDGVITEAARKAATEANPRNSLLRGSGEYRKEMVKNLVERAVHYGLERLEARHG